MHMQKYVVIWHVCDCLVIELNYSYHATCFISVVSMCFLSKLLMVTTVKHHVIWLTT